MSDSALLLTVAVTSGLTLLGLAGTVIFLLRTNRSNSRPSETQLAVVAVEQKGETEAFSPVTDYDGPLDNVITRLNFEQSLDSVQFATASQESALSFINNTLAARSGDGVAVVVSGINLWESFVTMTVSASKDGQALLESGGAAIARHASGKALPLIRDAKTGQWVEVMKEAKGAKAMARLGAISTALIGAAHIVSGADIAKRLKEVDAKINLLLAYRRIDEMSALERIYTSARELSSAPMSPEKSWELWRLRGELRELRIRWRRELRHQLGLIEDPNSAGWYRKMFNWIESVDRGPHSEVHGKITEGQLHISLIEYSIRLDQALAVASGTVPEFEVTLAGELAELESLAELLKSKGDLISKKYPELSVESTQKGLSAIVQEYRKLLPGESVNVRRLNPQAQSEDAQA